MNEVRILWLGIALIALAIGLTIFAPKVKNAMATKPMDYSELVGRIKKGEVESLTVAKDTAHIELKKTAAGHQWKYKTVLPEADGEFYKLARENVKSMKMVRSIWENVLVTLIMSFLLPLLLIVGLYMFIARQNAIGYKQAMSMEGSGTKHFTGNAPHVPFESAARLNEEKQRLKIQDKILLHGLVFHSYHGCHPAEAELGQKFVVDVELSCDLSAAGRADDLTKTIDYTKIYEDVKRIVEGKRYHLIETVAEDIAQTILKSYPVSQVCVRVKKPQVPIAGALESVGVEMVRSKQT
jgi:dihydroneopterin aldolase